MYQETLHFTKTAELCAAITTAHREAAERLGRDITDEMAVPAYLKGNPFSRWVFWGRLRQVVKQAHLRPNAKVFDFGCGTGVLLSRLAADGRTVYRHGSAPGYRPPPRRGAQTTARRTARRRPLAAGRSRWPDRYDHRGRRPGAHRRPARSACQSRPKARAGRTPRHLRPDGELDVQTRPPHRRFSGHYHVSESRIALPTPARSASPKSNRKASPSLARRAF